MSTRENGEQVAVGVKWRDILWAVMPDVPALSQAEWQHVGAQIEQHIDDIAAMGFHEWQARVRSQRTQDDEFLS